MIYCKTCFDNVLIFIKDVFGSFLFSIDFVCIYIYCRKFNAEFNKLIKTVGQRARFYEKLC